MEILFHREHFLCLEQILCLNGSMKLAPADIAHWFLTSSQTTKMLTKFKVFGHIHIPSVRVALRLFATASLHRVVCNVKP